MDRRKTRAKRVPWDAALAYWLALGPERRYAKVARKYGVSETAVRKHANQNGWRQRARRVEIAAAKEAEHRGVRLLADRIEDTIKIVEAARVRYAEQLSGGERVSVAGLVALLKIEALIERASNERVELRDVEFELRRVCEVARAHMEPGQFEAFLDELEQLKKGE